MLQCQRDLFSLPSDSHYLNCAYMSPLSKRVEQAGVEGIRRKAVPSEISPDDFFSGCARVRELFAKLVNAPDPERIAIMPAASYGLAVVARNTVLSKGQNVITAHHQFPSNMYVWRRLCADAGAQLRVIEPNTAGAGREATWNEAILEAVDRDTAVVALGHVHWTDGTRFDLVRIGERARQVGAALIVDGTQSVGAMDFDVQRIQPDALICAAYKWLTGPYAVGAAYYGPRYDRGLPLEETWIAREGSENFAGLVNYQDRYRAGAARFDVGEASNFILIPMFIAALEQVLEWKVPNIESYCRNLTAGLIEEAGCRGFGATDENWRGGHLFGLRLPEGVDLVTLQGRLRDRRIFVSVRGSVVRVAPHLYNDTGDIEALRETLWS
jgi:selenocysteine lyase/cysteine desulfurase